MPAVDRPLFAFHRAVLGDVRGPRLADLTWSVYPGDVWLVVGGPASGKSSLVGFLTGKLKLLDGTAQRADGVGLCASWEEQTELRLHERRRFTGDDLEPDEPGTPAYEWFLNKGGQEAFWESFRLWDLRRAGLRFLSTGETRKIWLALAFSLAQDVLVLDCPLDGLDHESRHLFQEILLRWKNPNRTVVITLHPSQTLDMPLTGVFWLSARRLNSSGNAIEQQGQNESVPVIEWLNGRVELGNRVLVEGLNWTVYSSEAWRLAGPNGCGKSTLITVLTGENPQAFCNDLKLFGKRRGKDLDLEEVRRRIRVVSNRQLEAFDERFWGLTSEVVLSGRFNTLGLDGDQSVDLAVARRLSEEFGLAAVWGSPFHLLSPAQRAAALAARACLVQPDLLILDEPDQLLPPNSLAILYHYAQSYLQRGTAVLLVTHEDRNVPDWVRATLEWTGNQIIVKTKSSSS